MTEPREVDPQLARQLVLDELFDLSLHESLRDVASGDEILGAVSGFFGAFGSSIAVLVAGLTVAVAGALSMSAGAWIARSCIGVISKRVWGVSV